MVNAAIMYIPVHWRKTQVATIVAWFAHIRKIAEMKELYITQDRLTPYIKTWPVGYIYTDLHLNIPLSVEHIWEQGMGKTSPT